MNIKEKKRQIYVKNMRTTSTFNTYKTRDKKQIFLKLYKIILSI